MHYSYWLFIILLCVSVFCCVERCVWGVRRSCSLAISLIFLSNHSNTLTPTHNRYVHAVADAKWMKRNLFFQMFCSGVRSVNFFFTSLKYYEQTLTRTTMYMWVMQTTWSLNSNVTKYLTRSSNTGSVHLSVRVSILGISIFGCREFDMYDTSNLTLCLVHKGSVELDLQRHTAMYLDYSQ